MRVPRILLLLCLLATVSCRRNDDIDWSMTLRSSDATPYGTRLAWESLPAYFPGARLRSLSPEFRYTGIDRAMTANAGDSVKLLVLEGLSFKLNRQEWASLIDFAAQGNEVLILGHVFDDKITASLGLGVVEAGSELEKPGPQDRFGLANAGVLQLENRPGKRYGYSGRSIRSHFSLPEADTAALADAAPAADNEGELDEAEGELIDNEPEPDQRRAPVVAEVLGRTGGRPDFVRYSIGGGHLSLHAAPLVLSNYFLLQDGNRDYLDGLWHSFPARVSAVYWQNYLVHSDNGDQSNHSSDTDLKSLFSYPATRNALLLAIGLLLLYVLFNLRRRQRVVPVIPPLQNTSVSFVETVGKLYYNRHDHGNLAAKMVQHFLDWLRSRYNLDTGQLDASFEKALAAKSGRRPAAVADLVQRLRRARDGQPFNEHELYQLYHILQSFYNQSTV